MVANALVNSASFSANTACKKYIPLALKTLLCVDFMV